MYLVISKICDIYIKLSHSTYFYNYINFFKYLFTSIKIWSLFWVYHNTENRVQLIKNRSDIYVFI